MAHRLGIIVRSWTPEPSNIVTISEHSFAVSIDDAKQMWFHTAMPEQMALVREAVVALDEAWDCLDVSTQTSQGKIVVNYDRSKVCLNEVIQIVHTAVFNAAQSFAAVG